MVGNFGEVLMWQFGEFGMADHQVKNSPIELNARVPMHGGKH